MAPAVALERAGAGFRYGASRTDGARISRAVCLRRRAADPQRRRLEAQELAYALAVAVQYLRALEAGGIALDAARAMIYFRLAADADQFLTMAKFRALRTLWARVEDACGLAPAPSFIAAETAWRMMTRRDPYVNMLRATIAVVGAGLGGADAITVLLFTLALGLPTASARIARNRSWCCSRNPTWQGRGPAGAGGIEDLTDKLCRAAWAALQEIEAAGGAWAALQQGLIQNKVAAMRGAREAAVARRKDALTGTSDFPDLAERRSRCSRSRPWRRYRWRPRRGSSRCRASDSPSRSRRCATPPTGPLAQTGARPKVFLAKVGTPADFTARATFAKNFFEAGGIEAVENDGFESRDALVAAFRASSARLACLCSSDAVYAREAVATAQALRDAGAVLLLAGRPGARGRAHAGRRSRLRVRRLRCARRAEDNPRSHCQLTANIRTARTTHVHRNRASSDEQSRPPLRLAQAHRPAQPDRDRDRGL